MNPPRHEMILASAGSGKTYELTNRFVRLIAGGAAPERIVALTFTRKAAGEFFDEILKKLARAATDAGYGRELARDIGARPPGPADYLRLLRAVVDAMPRLCLGTLDSFFARIVRNFPLELGLSGDFQIIEGAAARSARRSVLQRMFTAAGRPDAAQREFIEAFKRATFGLEEKRLAAVLDGFLDEHAEKFLAAPKAGQWGDPGRIWPEGCAWLDAAVDTAPAVNALRAWVDGSADIGGKQRRRWVDFIDALAAWSPGATPPREMTYVLEKALDARAELEAGRARLEFDRKKQDLDAPACRALAALARHIMGAEFARRLEMTRGLYAVLRGYDQNHDERVRRTGRLTFADVLRLLLPAAGAPVLSSERTGEARLLVDWRLDSRFDHWLLDEFQDTSFAQWSALRNLIDEAVQDPAGVRSFFYVGDVKQAIFVWREGDPRLFREIFEHYNRAAPRTIGERRLDCSRRSGPAVIETINRVFGDAGALNALLPPAAAEAWTREWRDHASAQPGLGGCAELRHADDEEGRFAATLRILREIEPQRRGLEAAVLVRTNQTATALADCLRRDDSLSAAAESDVRIATDNPLTCALLALLRAAAHPGDTMAEEHLRMTPLAALLAEEGLTSRDALTARVLADIHSDGFARTLERWLRRLAPAIDGDAFSEERGRLLVAAAGEFDKEGGRDVAGFLEFAGHYEARDTETAGAVRVMTIHKAKGLGFDLVILPDLEGRTLAERRAGLAVQKAPDRSVEWVLDLPPKALAGHDPVLAAHIATAEADAAYENLCLLYVAMTRAKRAMYVITEPVGEKAVSRNFPRLLRETLGEAWFRGDARWFEKIAAVPAPAIPAPALPLLDKIPTPRTTRPPAQRPSALKAGPLNGAQLFELTGAAEHGRAVHALLATVEWWHTSDAAGWAAARRGEGANENALAEALACLAEPALAAAFIRPASAVAEVWRERAFEVMLDETWVTGIFDRVVIERDAAGRAKRVTVFDFKTDRLAGAAEAARVIERYGAQLNLYRHAAAVLTGLAVDRVGCELVLTDPRQLARAPWPGDFTSLGVKSPGQGT